MRPVEIAACWAERSREQGEAVQRMTDIAAAYNSEIDLAITEMYRSERPAAANLIFVNVNQYGMRIAGPDPNVLCPPLRPGIKSSEQKADQRRRIVAGWSELNDMPAVRLQRALWLITFSMAPVVLRPDATLGGPRWEVRDPRRFFPSDARMQPRDAVAVTERPWGWLCDRYRDDPDTLARLAALHKRPDRDMEQGWSPHKPVKLLEWWDADRCEVIALGDAQEQGQTPLAEDQRACVLEGYDNLARVTPVANPTPVSLDPDKPMSQFSGMLGSYQMRSRLLSLSYIAVERGVFPEEWAEPTQANFEPEVVQVPEPRQGIIGIVKGGRIQRNPPDPQYGTGLMLDRLEAQERQGGSAPPEFGGNGATNVRTGRRGSQVMGATVDEYIATYQLRLAQSLQVEIDIAARIDRAYFGQVEKEMVVTLKGSSGAVKYRPDDVWETTQVKVRYPFAGVDISNLTLEAGQLVGLEAMARQTLMENHPLIEDVEREKDRITAENIERAFFQSLLAQAADPAQPVNMSMIAELRKLILSDRVEWWEAWGKVQADAADAQKAIEAGLAEQPMPGVDGGLVPDAGGAVASPESTMPAMADLNAMLMQTRGPRMTVSGEAA